MPEEKTALFWSGGKDSAMALVTMTMAGIKPSLLVTTVNGEYQRVSMHGVRTELAKQQAEKTGIPMKVMEVAASTNEEYEQVLLLTLEDIAISGITTVAFGDIFLEDLRKYREKQLAKNFMKALFPLWGRNTKALAYEIIACGIKARLCCINTSKVDSEWAGKDYSLDFIAALKPTTDPCGENGEFHTFCYEAPVFSSMIRIANGDQKSVEFLDPTGAGTPASFPIR